MRSDMKSEKGKGVESWPLEVGQEKYVQSDETCLWEDFLNLFGQRLNEKP